MCSQVDRNLKFVGKGLYPYTLLYTNLMCEDILTVPYVPYNIVFSPMPI